MKGSPGSCFHVAIAVVVMVLLALLLSHADAAPKRPHARASKPAPATASRPTLPSDVVPSAPGVSAHQGEAAPTSENAREERPARRVGAATSPTPKTYNFGGLDIDGKLKTPQLLYFLNRMKSELDTTTPDKRSFVPELERSTEEM